MPREDFAVRGLQSEIDPYGFGSFGLRNTTSNADPYEASPFAVQTSIPELSSYEASPLTVPNVVPAAQERNVALPSSPTNGGLDLSNIDLSNLDLSQFGGLDGIGALDRYGANFSGAFGGSGSSLSPQGVPTSYAFPENYGNPKNKIYNLTANADDNIRLKLVDGTTIFEGQGPEAAAKAAAIVQQLGKDFGTQSTWILDKQTAGGDWKQVSQDTVGEKKKTALNSFLDVVAPIAGAALAFVPGIGPVLSGMAGGLGSAGAAAIGAAGGSLVNSGLQNQNSAEAFKKAAIAAGTTFLGAKIAPSVTSAFKGLTPAASPLTTAGTQAVTQGGGTALTQAGTQALADAIPEIVVTGARGALTTGLGAGVGAGAGSLIPKTAFNPDKYNVDQFKVDTANPTTATNPPIDELTVTGLKTTPIDKLVSSTGSTFSGSDFGKNLRDTTTLTEKPVDDTPPENEVVIAGTRPVTPGFDASIAGSGVGAGVGALSQTPQPNPKVTEDNIDELTVHASPKVDTPTIVGAGLGAGVQLPATPDSSIEELVVHMDPNKPVDKPIVPTPVILPNGTLNPDFVNKDFTVDNPEGTTDTKSSNGITDKLADWIKAHPLEAASLGLTALSGLAGATSGTGSGTLSNMPGNVAAAGTRASLSPTFTTGTLPPPSNMFTAGARTPVAMNMSTDDWLRYGMGPEKSFFAAAPVVQKARGGAIAGTEVKPRTEFAVHGAGTGRSDDIPAVLSDGEYVMDAETVALLGDGSNKAGAEKLDQLRVNLRRHKGANLAKGRFSVNAKSPEKYLAGGRV